MLSRQTQDYIIVNSIDEIDPNKLSLSQLGTKYLDRNGNRYAVRFNKETRKAEIIRITLQKASDAASSKPRTGKLNSKSYPLDLQKLSTLLKNTKHPSAEWIENLAEKSKSSPSIRPSGPSISPERQSYPANQESETIAPSSDTADLMARVAAAHNDQFDLSRVDLNISDAGLSETSKEDTPVFVEAIEAGSSRESKYIDDSVQQFQKIKERIESVLNNIRNSKIFEATGDPSDNKNIVGNLTREFDIEFFQKLDKILNYHKELTSYPRSITYYTAKYESHRKQALQSRSSDQEKLKLVIRWEMQEMLLSLARKLKKMVLNALNVLNTKNENHLKQVAYNQQQMYKDARSALLYCSEDIGALLISLQKWADSEG
ncbi:hypothetical protein EHQ53_08960 [Leptospira langatensis]|uniref:Uncharacterized protein n=1 Tax=Leptospira langatensis TaxID=2484983 RepID=A0A5F1ZV16_9LEPT|nr:hypothetical protein [Leptospira langatensis]TGK01245.1 hypothetical protein EHO57_09910 [Leptospira langatensis]TGL42303.1 hypothetical protein EHQ53_08960 [Leptospira langatensis]